MEWIEFKQNNEDPQEIGEYVSALANSAALNGRASGYLVWGVADATHEIVGTTFNPSHVKKGNEELENWLSHLLTPRIDFHFHEFDTEAHLQIVILEVACAVRQPVRFSGQEYVRIGTYKKSLKDYPEKERDLWRLFEKTPFETIVAKQNQSESEVLNLLDYMSYYELLHQPIPEKKNILQRFEEEGFIVRNDSGYWDITNSGAILFARRLADFANLRRKAVRVIIYSTKDRINPREEKEGKKGYASGFQGLIDYILSLVPHNEVIEKALRTMVPMYPVIALRELIANTLIHQDFAVHGQGPMIEIFSDRIEITNPGMPMVATDRFLDSPPRSRNEGIAYFMRHIGVCEERGSGIDKVVFETEVHQLPAPLFEIAGENTRVVLFAHKPYSEMDRKERVRAIYLHASLRYVQRDYLTNSSLRDRFGIEKENSSMVSRLIKDAVEDNAIKPVDAESDSRKFARYWPIWA
jgi:predicted HTH transcriptional regulator